MYVIIAKCNFTNFIFSEPTVQRDTYTRERPTRCTLFLNNLFNLNYPQHISNK